MAVSQGHLPSLAYQSNLAKPLIRLALDKREPAFGVNCARGIQAAVGPERHFFVALAAREGHAFVSEPPTQAQAARLGGEDQQAQLRHGF